MGDKGEDTPVLPAAACRGSRAGAPRQAPLSAGPAARAQSKGRGAPCAQHRPLHPPPLSDTRFKRLPGAGAREELSSARPLTAPLPSVAIAVLSWGRIRPPNGSFGQKKSKRWGRGGGGGTASPAATGRPAQILSAGPRHVLPPRRAAAERPAATEGRQLMSDGTEAARRRGRGRAGQDRGVPQSSGRVEPPADGEVALKTPPWMGRGSRNPPRRFHRCQPTSVQSLRGFWGEDPFPPTFHHFPTEGGSGARCPGRPRSRRNRHQQPVPGHQQPDHPVPTPRGCVAPLPTHQHPPALPRGVSTVKTGVPLTGRGLAPCPGPRGLSRGGSPS